MKTHISVYPRATEKAYGMVKNNVYVFDVPVSANKQQIVAAVESQFGVKTVSIKTLVQSGKAIRTSTGKRSRPTTVNRKDLKKAYVTLAKGDSIKVFDEATPEEPAAKKEKK
jgi:large subunit ribosomal protein L23